MHYSACEDGNEHCRNAGGEGEMEVGEEEIRRTAEQKEQKQAEGKDAEFFQKGGWWPERRDNAPRVRVGPAPGRAQGW